jgi:putative transposase
MHAQTERTFFVTSVTWGRRSVFQTTRMAELFVQTLFAYRDQGRYWLHEFVLMRDHFHLLLTPAPAVTLERAMQFIKGGFSFRAGKEISRAEIWEASFTNHRIRDAQDYAAHRDYIHQNPVRGRLANVPAEYPYSSAHPGFVLDAPPQGLKPKSWNASISPA